MLDSDGNGKDEREMSHLLLRSQQSVDLAQMAVHQNKYKLAELFSERYWFLQETIGRKEGIAS